MATSAIVTKNRSDTLLKLAHGWGAYSGKPDALVLAIRRLVLCLVLDANSDRKTAFSTSPLHWRCSAGSTRPSGRVRIETGGLVGGSLDYLSQNAAIILRVAEGFVL